MGVQYIPLPPVVVAGTVGSEQTILTIPAAGTVRVTLFATNHSTSAGTLTVHSVGPSESASDATQIVSAVAVGVGDDPKLLMADLVVGAGRTLQVAASTGGDLNVYGQYRNIT